jgi:CelD/BcsL family acetyltransferase involved in cellulose biosynthesis
MESSRTCPPGAPLLLEPADRRWVSFTASQCQANIFHHPAWMSLLADCYGYHPFVVAVCDASGNICAGLPMMEVRSALTGRRWVSLPFTDHCAPLFEDADLLDDLTDCVVELHRDRSIPQIELRCELPTHPAIRSRSSHVLHTIKLNSDPELTANRVHHMHRRNIKVAMKRGVRIEWGVDQEHLDEFYSLHLRTRRRQGVPVQPKRFFDLLRSTIIQRGQGFILLAHKDNEYLAGAVFLHWHQTLTYKYGASTTDSLSLRPNNLLFWTAIRWGCENGYTLLDMGRTDSSNAGLRQFKSRWGAEEQPLIYSTLCDEPIRAVGGRLMRALQTVIRNSPLWVCRAAGEVLYRHVG